MALLFLRFVFFQLKKKKKKSSELFTSRIYISASSSFTSNSRFFSPPHHHHHRRACARQQRGRQSGRRHRIVMAKHHPDLIMCRKMPGIAIGRLCEKCDGKCVVCDSYVRPATLVRVCDECNYGSNQGRCVICNAVGVSDAYYCQGCVMQEKDRDGCPKIINLGSAKTDLFYHKKAAGEITGSGGRTY